MFIIRMVRGQKKTEVILYVVLWAILFAAPLLSALAMTLNSSQNPSVSTSIDWVGVLSAWSLLAVFCITFFIHNFLIAPLLVYNNRKWQYGICICILVVCFTLFQLYGRPHHPKPMGGKGKPRMEKVSKIPVESEMLPAPKEWEGKSAMEQGRPEDKGRPEEMGRPAEDGEPGRGPKDHDHEPPLVFGGQDSVAFIIMALLLGLNIGTKYFFKSLDDRKRMKELERENLTNQLAYLKYQINPHFFMNTLNNIHALVDIDPEQAKYTIEVLSKMMRYVLYEGNKSMAPLQKELDFIANYIELMRIRYTDKVRISLSLPKDCNKNIEVPSMLLITFVENAFKHGVSYRQDSFIEVSVRVDEDSHEIEFLCNNSRKPASEDKHGGVGLQNAQKRLGLIYGKDGYKMDIRQNEAEYRLLLRMPIKNNSSRD